ETLAPDYDPDWDIPGPVPTRAVGALGSRLDPSITPFYVETYPNYYGLAPRLDELALRLPGWEVLADEAHGSHFRICQGAPADALACGAALSVQSFHKTLGALTQASVLHIHPSKQWLTPWVDR